MTWERETGTRTYTVTETTYEIPGTPAEYRIIRRDGDRFMDVEWRPRTWPLLTPWQRIDYTDLTDKAIDMIEHHAEMLREQEGVA